MAEDRGIQSPEPMGYGKGRRLTRQMYSNYFMLPFLLMGILLIILPVIGLTVLSAVEVAFPPGYVARIGPLPGSSCAIAIATLSFDVMLIQPLPAVLCISTVHQRYNVSKLSEMSKAEGGTEIVICILHKPC